MDFRHADVRNQGTVTFPAQLPGPAVRVTTGEESEVGLKVCITIVYLS